MEKIFKVKLSRGIINFYWVILVMLILMTLLVPLFSNMESLETIIFVSVLSFVVLLFSSMIMSAYKMRFVIKGNQLTIHGVFFTKVIKKSEIKSVEKTLIPIGFRLFGASFLGGFYYIPGVGRAFVAMGNFNDGILIKTKSGKNYLITPENPKEFINAIKR